MCACPPAGTDARFLACRFPKPPGAAVKGPRDEVDIIASLSGCLFMIEAKARLSESLDRQNRASESDWEKLSRLNGLDEVWFLDRLSVGYARDLRGLTRIFALAYHQSDSSLPRGATGVHVVSPGVVRFLCGPTALSS